MGYGKINAKQLLRNKYMMNANCVATTYMSNPLGYSLGGPHSDQTLVQHMWNHNGTHI